MQIYYYSLRAAGQSRTKDLWITRAILFLPYPSPQKRGLFKMIFRLVFLKVFVFIILKNLSTKIFSLSFLVVHCDLLWLLFLKVIQTQKFKVTSRWQQHTRNKRPLGLSVSSPFKTKEEMTDHL